MKTTDLKRLLRDGSQALDEQLEREYGAPEAPEAPDAFEQPHPREGRVYQRFHRWKHGRGERLRTQQLAERLTRWQQEQIRKSDKNQ